MKRGLGCLRVGSRRASVALAACIVGAAVLAGSGSGHPAATPAPAKAKAGAKKLTLYSVATEEQFLNHADDRSRGLGNNPFGNYKSETVIRKEPGGGPFAGDRAVFAFNVFADAERKQAAGTATFYCQYGFNKTAFCDAAYILKGGDLVGAGQFDFKKNTFSLAITGGTFGYRSLVGSLSATPSAGHSQRLAFSLQ